MIKDNLIVIPFGLDWNWPADYEKQTALTLADKNIVIALLPNSGITIKNYLYNLIKKKKIIFWKKNKPHLWLFTPFYLLPLQQLRFIQKINFLIASYQLRLMIFLNKKWRKKKKLLWIFTSQFVFTPNWFGKNYFPLYDCVDFYSSPINIENQQLKEKEEMLIKKVGIVFTNSPSLYRLKKKLHPKTFQVPQGFATKLFLKKNQKNIIPRDLKKIMKPIIGFIGNIDYRIDFKLINQLAEKNPTWSFVFLGPSWNDPTTDKFLNLEKNLKNLQKNDNVFLLGRKSKNQIIRYIDNFDIGIIPYNTNYEFCKYCYPMKIFEFFARGKPVISTPIESLIPLEPYVKIAKNANEFEKGIKTILKKSWPKEYQKQQRQLAIANSWEEKIGKISQILKKEFPDKFND